MANTYVVYITAPPRKAKTLASKLVKSRLVACVNIVPHIQSFYWWKGKVQNDKEALLIVKTRRSLFGRLKRFVKKNHPYDVPEIIALPILEGHKPYLDWIKKETS